MKIIFFRHGIAALKGSGKEEDRPLTREGRKKTLKAAFGLVEIKVQPGMIFSSPFARALQTAEIAAEVLHRKKQIKVLPALKPGGRLKEVLAALQETPKIKEAVLVGHEPDLSDMISELLTGHTGLGVSLKKAGACCLEVDDLPPRRHAKLLWHLTSKQLRKLA